MSDQSHNHRFDSSRRIPYEAARVLARIAPEALAYRCLGVTSGFSCVAPWCEDCPHSDVRVRK